MRKIKLFVAVAFCLICMTMAPALAADKPNIAVMMVDNLGWVSVDRFALA